MTGRRLRPRQPSTAASARPAAAAAAAPRRVIGGIDPGTRQVGYAILALTAHGWEVLACGSIACGRGAMAGRLARIAEELEALFAEHRPTVVGIETAYFGRSAAAAIKMGQGRGVAMATAARSGAEVLELSPRSIKQAVTGFGGAEKEQVAEMATRLLGLARLPVSRDASDALGCALAVALQLHRGAVLQASLIDQGGQGGRPNGARPAAAAQRRPGRGLGPRG